MANLDRKSLFQRPETLLFLISATIPVSLEVWMTLLNNFAIEKAAFTGKEIGILQSLREVPGFLAFTMVFLLLFIREQRFYLLMLGLLGLGTAITGFFPTALGLYAVTVLMSTGYHFAETAQQSLSLQWTSKANAPIVLGRMVAAMSFGALISMCLLLLARTVFDMDYTTLYLIAGGWTMAVALFASFAFPQFEATHPQHKTIIIRKRYWLYYTLTFLSGARRQIFIVFAAFMLVEKFHYPVEWITALFILNTVMNMIIAPQVGKLIARFGERSALTFEYVGLIGVFVGYAFVENQYVAGGLYVIDHLFFAMAIAIKTYFQKIADPADISPTAGLAFTINHIAAVVIPALFGLIWLTNPSLVFLIGAGIAVMSLAASRLIPLTPQPGKETVLAPAAAPAE